ncbi:MAG: hypothetical protein QG626_73 [Patescibacteria group bacterium]|jgi:glycosyltransferase involved in cell wall biosynthesis|nr:hypothetical protein [Patescibacteria group bacterium]
MTSVSVIIPAKNEARYLPGLLAALKTQTYQPLEIILADAASTDNTRQIAEAAGCKIVAGGLPGAGRNAGAAVATGELLLFLDADAQITDSRFLELAVTEIQDKHFAIATPDIRLQGGNWADRFGHALYNLYVRAWGAWRPHAPGFCIFITRALFEKIKGFDESIKLAEDHELAMRAGKLGTFGFLNTVTIAVTDRRFRRDGSFKIAGKYVLAELHMFFLGPIRHDYFHYDFGYDEETHTNRQE